MKIFVFVLLTLASGLSAWTSVFAPGDGSGGVLRPAVNVSGRVFQLPDYSYVGYKLSQSGVGDGIPCTSVSITAANNSDITNVLAAAVTTVAAAGGGTVYLPAGSFQLSNTVWVKYSNLRIAGAGSASTTLIETSAYNPSSDYYESPLSFNAEGTPWTPLWMQESQALVATSSTDIARGSLTLTAGSTAGLVVGDWVVVQQLFWNNLDTFAGAGNWPPKSGAYASSSDWQFTLTYVRKIAAIAGALVTLDAPIPHAMLNANQPLRLFKPNPAYYIENVGLEGVSIQVQANANNTGSNAGRPAGIGVNFKSAFNAWCRDVKISNIAKHGFQPCWSARVTFLDCSVNGAQDMGAGGFGYGFDAYCSQEVLYKRCVAQYTRHGYTNEYPMVSDIVVSQSQTLKPMGVNTPNSDVDDTHLAYAQQVLWDKHYQQNTGIQAMNRGARSGAQTQETFASGAVWNYNNDGETLNWQADKVQLSPATYTAEDDALVIGVTNASTYDGSEDPNPYIQGTLMTGTPLQRGPRGNVAYEGLSSTGLAPASIFDAMLFTRMGHTMPPEVAPNVCLPMTPTFTATPTPSATATATPLALWNAEKQLDPFKATGQLYSSFQGPGAGSALALAVDSGAGNFVEGSEAVRVDYTFNAVAGGFAELLRGYGTNTLDLSFDPYGLSFWIKGTVGTDTVRLMLFEDQNMNGSPYDAGDEVWASPAVSVPGVWTKIVVPYASFGTYVGGGNGLLDLNRIYAWRIAIGNGAGTAHSGQVWVDDLRQLTTYAGAAPNNAVLRGSFIQLWNGGVGCGCGAWAQGQWDTELQKLKDLCQDTVFVQYGAWEDNAWYAPTTQAFLNFSNPTLGRIFTSATTLGMKVVVGLWFGGAWNTDNKTLAATYSTPLNHSTAVAGEIAGLYGSSPAFGGWYIPQEVNDLEWPTGSPQLPLLQNFLRDVAAAAKAAKNAPVYLAPFYGPWRPADDLQAWWDATLAVATGIDVIIPQDGVSAHANGEVDVPPYFAAMHAAALGRGRTFGATIESFKQTDGYPVNGNPFAAIPMPITSLKSQLWEAKAAGATTLVQFEYPYMQSSRGAPFAQLYSDYKAYQQSVAPCSPATVTPSPSRTPTVTVSPSGSPSPSTTPTQTAQGSSVTSITPLPIPSQTPTATCSLSATSTVTATLTLLSTGSPSVSSTFTAVLGSGTLTQTLTATPSPESGSGALQILEALPVPNPGATSIFVRLNGAADKVELKLYSPAMTLLAQTHAGPLSAGWNAVALPLEWQLSMVLGLNYVRCLAYRGSQGSLPSKPVSLYRLN